MQDNRDDLYWIDAAGNRTPKPPMVVWHEAHLQVMKQRRRENRVLAGIGLIALLLFLGGLYGL